MGGQKPEPSEPGAERALGLPPGAQLEQGMVCSERSHTTPSGGCAENGSRGGGGEVGAQGDPAGHVR